VLVVREDEVDGARDDRQDERRDHSGAARPRTRLAVVALAEDVVIHRRTPKSTLIYRHHDTSRWPRTVRAVGASAPSAPSAPPGAAA
jgi:hypothetical protein